MSNVECRWFYKDKLPKPQKGYRHCERAATWTLTNQHGLWHYCDEHHLLLTTEGDPKGLTAHQWKPISAQGKRGPR